jgi:AraC-like DNA-binding protein
MQRTFSKTNKQRDRARLWQVPYLQGVDILHAHYVTQSFTRHAHDAFVISVIDQGKGDFWYRGSLRNSSAGCVGLLNPAEPHTGHVVSDHGWAYRALYVDPDVIFQLAGDITDKPWQGCWFPQPIIYDEQLAQRLRRLHHTLSCSGRLECESEFLAVLSHLLLRYAEHPPIGQQLGQEHKAIVQVRDYIDAHYAENISLQTLADIAQLNPFYLSQVFRKAVGLPPHVYLNQVRVSHAKALILAGEAIAQAAYATGFVDQSHLTRRFKQIFGITPGQLVRYVA